MTVADDDEDLFFVVTIVLYSRVSTLIRVLDKPCKCSHFTRQPVYEARPRAVSVRFCEYQLRS